MQEPLAITFDHLALASNRSAVEVLLHALSVPLPEIRFRAVKAILQSPSTRAHFVLIQRFDELGEDEGRLILAEHRRIEAALRHALQHADVRALQNALEIIVASGSYGMLPLLLGNAAEAEPETRDRLLMAVLRMVDSIYEQLHTDDGRKRATGRTQAEAHCRQALLDLDQACAHRFDNQPPDEILQAILVLGTADSAAVRKLLWQAPQEYRVRAADQLQISTHPGICRLLCDGLGMNYPHPRMLEAIAKRTDMPFIIHLLRWLPTRLSATQQKNFRQLEQIAWLTPYRDELAMIPPALQPNLVRLLAASGLKSDTKREIQEWLLRNGSPEGRDVACESLGLLNSDSVRSIVSEELNSTLPQDQAWALRRVRDVDLPDALAVLVEQLDSPHEVVQEAARSQLQGFNVERLLDLLDQMDPQAALRAGILLRKTDPAFAMKLSRELASPVHRRRIRASYGASCCGLQQDVVRGLMALLEDPDPIVRRVGVETLASVNTPVVRRAIGALADDSSPRVREVVAKVLGPANVNQPLPVEWPQAD